MMGNSIITYVAVAAAELAGAGQTTAPPARTQSPHLAMFMRREQPEPASPAIRPITPATAPRTWVKDSDYPTLALREKGEGSVTMRVTLDAGDRVTACVPIANQGDPAAVAGACALARERVRLRHGLASDGTPVGGDVQVELRWYLEAPPPAPPAPPAPPPGPQRWDPVTEYRQGLELVRTPKWQDFAPADRTGRAEVTISMQGARKPGTEQLTLLCSVNQSSGDTQLDAQTCKAAMNGEFRLLPVAPDYSALPMIVRWKGKRAEVQLPSQARGRPFALDTTRLAIRGVPADAVTGYGRAVLLFDADGAVKTCGIEVSAGSDLADAAACHQLSQILVEPAIDVFGRKREVQRQINLRFVP